MKNKSIVITIFLLGILISSFIFSPLILDYTLTPRLIAIAITLIVCVFLLINSKEKQFLKLDIISFSYLSLTIYSCFSIFWANTPSESFFENSKLVVALFVFAFSIYSLNKDKDYFLNSLGKISVIIAFIELLLVAYQLTITQSFSKEAMYEIYGSNSHKNLLSSFLFINLFFLIRNIRQFKNVWKLLSIIGFIINLAIIALIRTKAVWMAIIIALVLYGFILLINRIKWQLNSKWLIIGLIVIANLFFIFVQPQIIKQGISFNEVQHSSQKTELDNERLQLWDKTYHMIQHHSLLGVGSGNWQIHFPNATLSGIYRAEDLNYTFQRPHNDILWIISETGFVGFNLFLVFTVSILVFLIKSIKLLHQKNEPNFDLILCVLIIIGYLTASFFDFPKERIEHGIWITIIFAIAYFHIKEHSSLITLYEKNLTKTHYVFSFVLLIGVAVIGSNRYKGEYYTRKMYDFKKRNDNIGVIRESKKAINFAYTIDPTSLPIKWYSGNSYAILGNFQASKADLLEAYKLNPFNRNVVNDLASAYASNNQIDSAKKYYLEAKRISPRFDDPKLNLTAIYFNEKQFARADTCLKSLLHDSERRTKYQKMVDAFLGR